VIVNETPTGATGSVLYTALMAYISVDQFETMMRALVAAERIAHRGDRYFPIGQRGYPRLSVTVVPTKSFATVGGIIEINLLALTNTATREKQVITPTSPA
jgi:hypothetical protein